MALAVRLSVQAKRQRSFQKIVPEYDIYHEAGFFPFKACGAAVKTVFTIHDASILRHPEYHPKERVQLMNMFLRKRTKLADSIITVSEFSKKEISNFLHLSADDINVTPLAHNPDLFVPDREDILARLKEAGLPQRFFLFVGSGDPRKNVNIIPKALELAQLDTPFVNVGWSGWDETKNDNILNLGYVSDDKLSLLYQGATALVYPSLYEGFGLPLVEAMACGCPIITTRKASLPEVAGTAALYLENPDDPAELAILMGSMENDGKLRSELSEKSIRQAARFSWTNTAKLTMRVFQQTLSGNP